MSRKAVVLSTIAIVAIVVVIWFVRRRDSGGDTTYRLAPVQLGTIQQTVSATGALSAVKTVQVGTQVSGQVAEIHADFNDQVKKGQLLARIDPTLQQQAVADAQAQLEKSQAQLVQAQQEYNRNSPLFKQQFISATEFGTVQVNLSVAQADVKSSQVTLDKAKQNLSYTNIYAPIDGVIIERDVDVGQTVAASLSAPQLFLIAQNLEQMQILAAVDESDISTIKEGQSANFTVQSFPGRTFTGTVQQVRLESKLTDNVVSYTVVVTLSNADGKLLPGMTATVAFVTGSATNVLTVPNAALRFKPTSDELVASGLPATAPVDSSKGRGGRGAGRGDSTTRGTTGSTPPSAAGGAAGGAAATRTRGAGRGGSGAGGTTVGGPGTLWTVDAGNNLKRIAVRVGLSDGQRTQVSGTGVIAGMQVIVGTTTAASEAPAAPSANPLAPAAAGGGRRGGP